MENEQVLNRVKDLGKTIEKSKADEAKYTGGMEQIQASLKAQLGIDDMTKAALLRESLEKEYNTKLAELKKLVEKLSEVFHW